MPCENNNNAIHEHSFYMAHKLKSEPCPNT